MTSLFIVVEMTRDYSLILPLMVGVATATVIAQLLTRDTVYSIKLNRLGVIVPDEPQNLAMDNIPVSEAMTSEIAAVSREATLEEVAEMLSWAPGNVLAVQEDGGQFVGLISATDVATALQDGASDVRARDLEIRQPISVYPDDSLSSVVAVLSENNIRQVPVVARWDERRLLGVVEQSDVITAFASYSARVRPRRKRTTVPVVSAVGAAQLEVTVEAGSFMDGRSLAEIDVPTHAVVTEVRRNGVVLVPRGGTILSAGDRLAVLAESNLRMVVERSLRRQAGAGGSAGPDRSP